MADFSTAALNGQIGTNNLTTDKIETKVQSAPSFAFSLGFVLVFQPLALAEDLQAGAVDNQMDRT
ncbi:hypothetical protein H0Z56_34850 [Rhizobium leguminosarum]|nr:hypothetical protein [Rhizobium leguminosarum]QIO63223.1 hypothetical protein HA463_36805 [Rhizobium leguminosarum bv. trifolii]